MLTTITAVRIHSRLGPAACRSRGRNVYRLVIFESHSSFFTPIRCFPQKHFKSSLHSGMTLNYSLRLYGLFVLVPQPFAYIAGSVGHVNLTSTSSFPRT